jgi:NAD(P)-dependent dehydrogenase (short-subunit alcohol dehydrogenase family)
VAYVSGTIEANETVSAIETFTRGLAAEVAREGIRVNAVAPGVIETAMTPDARDIAEQSVPMGRVGEISETPEAVSWLLSPASFFVTGTILTVSGDRWRKRLFSDVATCPA